MCGGQAIGKQAQTACNRFSSDQPGEITLPFLAQLYLVCRQPVGAIEFSRNRGDIDKQRLRTELANFTTGTKRIEAGFRRQTYFGAHRRDTEPTALLWKQRKLLFQHQVRPVGDSRLVLALIAHRLDHRIQIL